MNLPVVPGEVTPNIQHKDTAKGFCRVCGNEGWALLKSGDAAPCKWCEVGQKIIGTKMEKGHHVVSYALADLDPDNFAVPPWAPAAPPEEARDAISEIRKTLAKTAAKSRSGFGGRDPLGKLNKDVYEPETVESTAEEVPNDPDFIGDEPPPPPVASDDDIPF